MARHQSSVTDRIEPPVGAVGAREGDAPGLAGDRRTGDRGRHRPRWVNGGTVAVLAWLLATPVAFVGPDLIDKNPLSVGATTVPLVGGACLAVAAFLVALRWRGDLVAGAVAGLAAAWTVLMLRTALVGTPYGFGGLYGDAGRTTASATRYTTTIASSDTFLPALPSEYPPMFTWLVGRAAVLLDEPAWRLVGAAQVLFMSAAVLAGFLLWRRLTGPWAALAISVLTLLAWSDPRKAYEVLTLVIFVPWALETFARTPGRRLHWLPAGLLGGFVVLTYQAWLVYAMLGIVVLVVIAWREEPDRWRYLGRLGLIGLTAFAVSAWYVVPYVWATLTVGGKQVSDLYATSSINEGLFPFLELTPIGLLQLAGLIGLVWLWRSVWWARPLLILVVGVYAYRLLAMIRFGLTGHTTFLHYTFRLYAVLLAVAGVLVVAYAVPVVLRRLRAVPPRHAAAAGLAIALAWAGTTFAETWMPPHSRFALDAHVEPLPGGGYPRYAPAEGRRAWFPATPIRRAVESVLGPHARPVTLTVDDRIFAYVPWRGYVDGDRTASATLGHWDDRMAQVRRLVAIREPGEFAARSRDTKYGPIDVFVLKRTAAGWTWRGETFSPAQFAPEHWTVVDDLPADLVVAVRR